MYEEQKAGNALQSQGDWNPLIDCLLFYLLGKFLQAYFMQEHFLKSIKISLNNKARFLVVYDL